MTDEHDYGGISHEEIMRTDSFQSMQVSIAALSETVTELAQKFDSRSEVISAYPKPTVMQDDESVSLYGENSSTEEHAGCVNEEPTRKLSKRTRLQSERTISPQVSKRTSLVSGKTRDKYSQSSKRTSVAEKDIGKSSDLNSLFAKSVVSDKETPPSNFEVEEDILSAVEAERLPGTTNSTGKPVLPNLAERVVRYWNSDIKKSETYKILQDKYKTPANCDSISVPLINEVSYHSLSGFTKRLDHEMAEIQKGIITATNAVANISESILQADKSFTMIDSKEVIKMCFDSITMLGTAHAGYCPCRVLPMPGTAHARLNNKRKHSTSTSLDPEIKDVCSSRHSVTGYLFGDDLPKAIKDAKEVSKLSKSVASPHHLKGKKRQYHNQSRPSYHISNNYRGTSSKSSFFQQAKKPNFIQKRSQYSKN